MEVCGRRIVITTRVCVFCELRCVNDVHAAARTTRVTARRIQVHAGHTCYYYFFSYYVYARVCIITILRAIIVYVVVLFRFQPLPESRTTRFSVVPTDATQTINNRHTIIHRTCVYTTI